MKFSYKQINDETYRPIIPIKLTRKNESVNYEVLVDSGADLNIFDAEMAEVIGIELETGEESPFAGISGEKQTMYIHPVSITVGGWEYQTKAGFADLPSHAYGIVGQKGFFSFFRITFDYTKKKLYIKRKDN